MLAWANPMQAFHVFGDGRRKSRVVKAADPSRTRLTIRQVADELQCSEKTVWRWIKAGDLVAQRAGKGWRIHRNAIEGFLAKQQQVRKSRGRQVQRRPRRLRAV
ncbi:MAG: helix-turn-helix domain-containing protein [Deltaproteobacteria bacterium]|nr:helix-turn-helix domain-containing protein [Deltaproteobacteria bacterium]